MFKGSFSSQDLAQVVRALKSAAEPTRLRLLFLLSQAEYTVGELATVLNQSEPRVSRHLRLLTEAGFLDDFASSSAFIIAPRSTAVISSGSGSCWRWLIRMPWC